MEFTLKGATVRLVRGDITTIETDVIVNAANSALVGGGGVDGAIHRVGGPEILKECRAWVAEHGKLPRGRVMSTTAGALPAKVLFHTVGPVWQGGNHGEFTVLESCYARSLALAAELGHRRIAFPAISTGVYGFPIDRAAYVATMTCRRFIVEEEGKIDDIQLVVYSAQDLAAWEVVFEDMVATMTGDPT